MTFDLTHILLAIWFLGNGYYLNAVISRGMEIDQFREEPLPTWRNILFYAFCVFVACFGAILAIIDIAELLYNWLNSKYWFRMIRILLFTKTFHKQRQKGRDEVLKLLESSPE